MASRDYASAAMILLMFLCVGSAHRLFLEAREGISPSAAHTKHIEPIAGRKHDSTSEEFEKPASEPWGLVVPRGEDQTNEPRDLDLDLDLDRPAEKAKQDGNGPWDLDRPTEKEKQDGEPLKKYGSATPKAYWARTQAYEPDPWDLDRPAEKEKPDGEPVRFQDEFSGDLANIYPEFYYLN